MFEFIYDNFQVPGFFRLFGFVTFRALLAGITAFLLAFFFGDYVIRRLRQLNFNEVISTDGPDSHQSKAGTPTMGGILILGSLAIACILFGDLGNLYFILLLVFTLLMGGIGFWDDYYKVVKKKKNGMSARLKMGLSLIAAMGFCLLYLWLTPESPRGGMQLIKLPGGSEIEIPIIAFDKTGLFAPFLKGQLLDLGLLAVPFWILVFTGSTHAVNLTDGLDGLAIGNFIIVGATLGALAYITGTPNWAHYLNLPMVAGANEVAVFMAALTGAAIGFLWFNAPPAQVFMGDTGSLALGGALGMCAILIKKEILLFIIGGVFVMEALSVILQVGSYRLRKKRIFKMAPLHHHYELKGWPETRVVIRFWLVGILLSLIAISTLRLQ